jgi:hypothetical protein
MLCFLLQSNPQMQQKKYVLYMISRREQFRLRLLRVRLEDSVTLVRTKSKDRRQTVVAL